MNKTYIVEVRQRVSGSWTAWSGAAYSSTLEQARVDLASSIGGEMDREDRGEEFEADLGALVKRAAAANIGDVLTYDDDIQWRIAEEV